MGYKLQMYLRQFSSSVKGPRVCIVGAGPAGFYAAMHITKHLANVTVDILEKLPVPFGLIRYGVAPDHPEVKNVINQFTKVAKHPNVNFYGNISLGQDIKIAQLRQHYDAVLLSYGADQDRVLGIENENNKNVLAARNFVGWYNGLPFHKDLQIDLSGHTAAILGQGNVALDVARILMSPVDELRKTDITEHALNALAESKIKEVFLIGRRGPLQVAFTIKELREQLKLPNCNTIWRQEDFIGISEQVADLPRPRKRLTELMLKSVKEDKKYDENKKNFKPVFFRSPKKFIVNNKNELYGLELTCNKLVGEKLEDLKCVPTGKTEVINCDLVFRSIGYKSVKVEEDLVFSESGVVPNDKGRVVDHKQHMGSLYVAGWLGTGPVGVILNTMGNAFQVAKLICEDLSKNVNEYNKAGFNEVKKIILSNNDNIVDWSEWEKIDKYETELGKIKGKPREKLCCINKMLQVAKN